MTSPATHQGKRGTEQKLAEGTAGIKNLTNVALGRGSGRGEGRGKGGNKHKRQQDNRADAERYGRKQAETEQAGYWYYCEHVNISRKSKTETKKQEREKRIFAEETENLS